MSMTRLSILVFATTALVAIYGAIMVAPSIEWIDQYGDRHQDKNTCLAKSSSRAERDVICHPTAVGRQKRPDQN